MIRIYKNNDIKYVTKGAYESFYRPLGYNKVIETPVVKPKVEKEIKTQLNEEVKPTPKRRRVSSKKNNRED